MKQLMLVILLLLTFESYSQQKFLLSPANLTEIRAYEASIQSENLGFEKTHVAQDYFKGAKRGHDYYPLCFTRTNDDFNPELKVTYFYDEKDSSLLATSYDWDLMDHVTNIKTDAHKFDQELKKKKAYLSKYKAIKQELIEELGKPSSIQETKTATGYIYNLRWNKDGVKAWVTLQFSTKLKELPGNMKIGSFRIRAKFDYL